MADGIRAPQSQLTRHEFDPAAPSSINVLAQSATSSSCGVGCHCGSAVGGDTCNCDDCVVDAPTGSHDPQHTAMDWARTLADARSGLSEFWRSAMITDAYVRAIGAPPSRLAIANVQFALWPESNSTLSPARQQEVVDALPADGATQDSTRMLDSVNVFALARERQWMPPADAWEIGSSPSVERSVVGQPVCSVGGGSTVPWYPSSARIEYDSCLSFGPCICPAWTARLTINANCKGLSGLWIYPEDSSKPAEGATSDTTTSVDGYILNGFTVKLDGGCCETMDCSTGHAVISEVCRNMAVMVLTSKDCPGYVVAANTFGAGRMPPPGATPPLVK